MEIIVLLYRYLTYICGIQGKVKYFINFLSSLGPSYYRNILEIYRDT